MLCEKCGKNTATVVYTQIINGHKESLNLCSKCAGKESIFDNFGSLLSFSPYNMPGTQSCPTCKTTLSEFTRSGRVGCGQCYDVFRNQAATMLKKIHGTSVHTEKTEAKPQKEAEAFAKSEMTELEKLKTKLSEAIAGENFEEAAILRDKIRSIEKEDKK